MQSTFQAEGSTQAVIRNTGAAGTEQLVVNLHPESGAMIDIQIAEYTDDQDLVSSAISINQAGLQQLVRWLREQGVVE